MSFALNSSVTMRWFFGDGKPQELAYAGKVLDAMKQDDALVPTTWGLEVALRSGLPLATLDEDLQKAAKKADVKMFV